jgi:hypothetical protein
VQEWKQWSCAGVPVASTHGSVAELASSLCFCVLCPHVPLCCVLCCRLVLVWLAAAWAVGLVLHVASSLR